MRIELRLGPNYKQDVMDIWRHVLSNNFEEWSNLTVKSRTDQVRMFLFGQQVALRCINMDTAASEITNLFADILTNDNWTITSEWDINHEVIDSRHNNGVQE